jgi:hypothetical protein
VLANGTAAANTIFGVRIELGSHETVVGPDNIISRNGGGGVQIQATGSNPTTSTQFPTLRNTITRNRISLNSGLGIDLAPLGQVTTNNTNNNVNGGVDAPGLFNQGSEVRGFTCSNCTVELFVADTTSTTAHGEGATYVASDQASGGLVIFDARPVRGRVVTATATDTNGNTSEFSRNLAVS